MRCEPEHSMSKGWLVYWSALVGGTILGTLIWAPPSAIEAVAKLLGAASPMVTVGLAIFGLFVWRVQLVAKRRFEIAEEALVNTFAVVYALQTIRSPMSYSAEGRTRKAGPNETPEQKEKLDYAFVPFERAKTFDAQFAALEKSALLVEAHFDVETSKQMRTLVIARNRVIGAAMFVHKLGEIRNPSQSTISALNKWNAVLHESNQTDDPDVSTHDVLSVEIYAAKDAIVTACQPYLAEPKFGSIISVRI